MFFEKEPLVSVGIPAHDTNEKLFIRCLDSIVKQTYRNLEIIVSDDSKGNNVAKTLSRFKDPRIKYIRKKPEGVHANRQLILRSFKGEFFTFVDSDDAIDLNYIEFMVKALSLSSSPFECLVITDYDNINHSSASEAFSIEKIADTSPIDLFPFKISYSVWGKLFPRKSVYLLDVKLDDGADDYQIVLKSSLNICEIIKVHGTKYHYLYNPNSIVHASNNTFLYAYKSYSFVLEKLNHETHETNRINTLRLSKLICKARLESINYSESFPRSNFFHTVKEIKRFSLRNVKLEKWIKKQAILIQRFPLLFLAVSVAKKRR